MENRNTLKILGTAFLAIGLAWYILSQIAKLEQAEVVKLQIARDIERAKSAAVDREKIIEQEQEKSLQFAQQLEKERRLQLDTEQKLDKERQLQQENRSQLKQLEAQLEAAKVKSSEDMRKLEEERRKLNPPVEKAESENRVRPEVDTQVSNSPPVQNRSSKGRYPSRFDNRSPGKMSSSLPENLNNEQISARAGQEAANELRRVIYRNRKTNSLVVADPVGCGRTSARVRITAWQGERIIRQETVVFPRAGGFQ